MWEQLQAFFGNFYEVTGFVLTLICVWFNTKEDVRGWFFGILSCITYAHVYYQNKVYAEFGLQFFYISASLFGWYQWKFGKNKVHKKLMIQFNTLHSSLIFLLIFIVSYIALYLLLSKYTDTDVPVLDALTTAISVTAQIMLTRKYIENWILWIIANSIYIYLFIFKGLFLTAILFGILWVMAIYGYVEWLKLYKRQSIT